MSDKIEPKKYVKIPVHRLVSFINDSIKLDFLEAGGVDNWEWYGESLEGIENEYVDDEYVLTKYEEVKDE